MIDLSTEIAGVRFENPIVIGSSALTNRTEKLRKLVDAGAGGLTTKLISHIIPPHHVYVAKTVLKEDAVCLVGDLRVKLEEGVKMVKQAKKELKVPIITNICGLSGDVESWLKITRALGDAGADMIELDMWPGGLTNPDVAANVIRGIKKDVGIPIVMKFGVHYYDYIAVGKAGAAAGADVVSGTNAVPGILPPNIERDFVPPYPSVTKQGLQGGYMGPALNPIGLNFTLRAAKLIKLPVISGGGVMTWQNVVERMVLGGNAVSLVSAVYLKGLPVIKSCIKGLKRYLDRKGIDRAQDLVGIALPKYGDTDPSETLSPLKPECVDPKKYWPKRLSNEWWTS